MPPVGPYAARQRDGLSSIINLAQELCRLNASFGPIIKSRWNGTPSIIALVTVLDNLCPLLQPASDAQFDFVTGGDNDQIDDEGGQLYVGRLPNATDPTP